MTATGMRLRERPKPEIRDYDDDWKEQAEEAKRYRASEAARWEEFFRWMEGKSEEGS